MAKSDVSLGEIDTNPAYSPPRKAKFAEDKDINGFDTETIDGDIFAVSFAFQNESPTVAYDRDILDSETLWNLVTHKKCRSALNMWYNLDFDANVLLSHLLDKEELSILVASKSVSHGKYDITYIPGKFLTIKENRNVYTHYDASQFFYTSLENAAKEWLQKDKLTESIDASLFGTNTERQLRKIISRSNSESWESIGKEPGDTWTLSDAHNYIDKNHFQIKKYAKRDAMLVRDLWQKAVSIGEGEINIPMGLPFSTGYLAESYLNHHLVEKPGVGEYQMASMAWDSYAGGRFEVIQRGDIGDVIGVDINSAYPYFHSQLPDPKMLEWKNKPDPTIQEIKDADYGFINATVTTDKSRAIQPFAVKMQEGSTGKLKFPALERKEITCIKDIFEFAFDNDYIEDYYIHDSWLAHKPGNENYPFSFIPDLYEERKLAARKEKPKRELLLKIVLNSMYGKMCQTTPKRKEVTNNYTLDEKEKFIGSLSLPSNLREGYPNGIIETLEAGSYFNPFLASYITGLTRLELHKSAVNHRLEDNTVMLATDCLMFEKDAFEKSDFDKRVFTPDYDKPEKEFRKQARKSLGMWDIEYAGKAFVIGAGVYQIDMKDKIKLKTRGFNEKEISNLRQEAQKANGHIEVISTRPQTAAEAIWQNRQVSSIGEFQDFPRSIKPDMDTKRDWNQTATFDSLLSKTEHSKPLIASEKS